MDNYFRRYPIAYRKIDPDNTNCDPIPTKAGDSYLLRAPMLIAIDAGKQKVINTGLIIGMPPAVNLHLNDDNGAVTLIIRAHLETIDGYPPGRGLTVMGPRTFTADDENMELKIWLMNQTTENITLLPGQPMAELYFTVSPPIILAHSDQIVG